MAYTIFFVDQFCCENQTFVDQPLNHPSYHRSILPTTCPSILPYYQSCLPSILAHHRSYLPQSFPQHKLYQKSFNTYLTKSSPTPSKMSEYEERLATFTTAWPHTSPSPKDLARLNLRHRPTSEDPDNVICDICLHSICDWQPDKDPAIKLRILHLKCLRLWNNDFGSTISLEKPLPKTIGFFDPSLKYDLPELCLFQDVYIFCDRIKRCRHVASDILDVLPRCLRGEALKWFNQSDHQNLAVCIRDMRAKFARAPPEAPLKAL